MWALELGWILNKVAFSLSLSRWLLDFLHLPYVFIIIHWSGLHDYSLAFHLEGKVSLDGRGNVRVHVYVKKRRSPKKNNTSGKVGKTLGDIHPASQLIAENNHPTEEQATPQ